MLIDKTIFNNSLIMNLKILTMYMWFENEHGPLISYMNFVVLFYKISAGQLTIKNKINVFNKLVVSQ